MECVLLLACWLWRADGDALEGKDFSGIDIYNIPDALDPEVPMDASVFMNSKSATFCSKMRYSLLRTRYRRSCGTPRTDEQELDVGLLLPLQYVPLLAACHLATYTH